MPLLLPTSACDLRAPQCLKIVIGLVIGLLGYPSALPGQTPTPTPPDLATLNNLHSAFHLQIATQSQKLTVQYERALARLEAEVADAGDYEQALQIKRRRDQLQQIQATNGASTPGFTLPLTPLAAKGPGVATTADSSLTGWKLASHYSEWTLSKLTPGDYFLELDSMMTPVPQDPNEPSSGSRIKPDEPEQTALFEIHEVSLLAGAADNRRSFELKLQEGGSPEFTPQRIGPMRFVRSPVTLRLSASRSYPANQVTFRNIRLVAAPAITEGTTSTIAQPPASDVSSLRASLATALDLAYQPINDRYAVKLDEFARQHPDWQPLLDNERRGLEKFIAWPTKSRDPGTLHLPKPLASLGGIAGFQDLENVTFVDHPDNTGDRFRVKQDNKEFVVRLLWLRCAPPTQVDAPPPPSHTFSQHFGLAPEDAALFGRAALQFTSGYLTGKTFRLLIRNTPEADGTIPALLFLPDIGLFHNLLIDQGLAAVVGKTGNGGTLERALQQSIRDREQDARGRIPRPGAWALSPDQTPPNSNP
jgi:hypothetical protein